MAHLPSFTFILLIIFIAIISFVGVFKLSHDSNEDPARITKVDKNARNIEQYIARLEKEVNKISSATPPTTATMNKEVENEPETDNTIANEPESSSGLISVNDRHKAWRDQLFLKLKCLRLKQGTLYLYHVRKAAGTSIRDVMHSMSRTWKVPYFETEGIVLDSHLLEHHKGLTSVLTLREPVNRILSLYWYEHVGWFDGILKQTQKCKTLVEWVGAWRDGAEWKRNFVLKNPGTVYVEIENYYVKMLTGWRDGDHVIDETDFQRAKVVLEQFDLVFLTDWMGDDTQVDAMNAVFPGRSNIAMGHKIRGDHNAKTRLIPTLAPNETVVRETLKSINSFDLRLWDYAQSLMAYRLKLIVPVVNEVKKDLGLNAHRNTVGAKEVHDAVVDGTCNAVHNKFSHEELKGFGIFRPPGHKGPL